MILDEIKNIKSDKNELKKFGMTMGFLLLLLAGLFFWRGKEHYLLLFCMGVFFLLFGFIFPVLLKPVHKVWMAIAIIIGYVMTRVILCALFYLVITPMAFFSRLFGKDALELKFDRKTVTYWKPKVREPFDKSKYENQF